MRVVWTVFLATAVVLLGLAVVGLRRRGEQAGAYHVVGWGLLVLSSVTALFPLALGSVGAALWAGFYIGLVVVTTGVTTWWAVSRARAKTT